MTQIINGKRAISTDTAYRLAKCFGTSVAVWLDLQADYDLELACYNGVPEKVGKEFRPLAG